MISLFDTYTCVEIAKIVGVTVNQVYEVRKRYKLTNKINPIFKLDGLKEQIILGGKLGDGNFKKNGSTNYYYRESHAEDEKEYLLWKMNVLGKEMICRRGIYKIKKGGWNQQQSYGFSTKTSPTFVMYKNLTISETIQKLDYRGLIIFMLDDGWFCKHSKNGHFLISGGILTYKELEQLCGQFEKYGIRNVHIVGNERYDVSIPRVNNQKLYEMAIDFMPKDIDIIAKKFNTNK